MADGASWMGDMRRGWECEARCGAAMGCGPGVSFGRIMEAKANTMATHEIRLVNGQGGHGLDGKARAARGNREGLR